MMAVLTIARREFTSLFATPLAALFLVIFVATASGLAFFLGHFFARGQADLVVFFAFHPWLYLILMPALGMRAWAEERHSGTIELLMSNPVTVRAAVWGKYLAMLGFAALALALTFPMWLTVAYLGAPDNGVILASYLGSLLVGGMLLAIAMLASALARSQVEALVIGVAACAILLILGQDGVLSALVDGAPGWAVTVARTLSPTNHYLSITRGVLELTDLVWAASFIWLMLVLAGVAINLKRGR